MAVVARPHRGPSGPRPGLALLPAPFRHRAHLPVRQAGAGLDRPEATHSRAGRRMDLADPDRADPATPGPRPGRRSPAALATATTGRPVHARPGPPRFQ